MTARFRECISTLARVRLAFSDWRKNFGYLRKEQRDKLTTLKPSNVMRFWYLSHMRSEGSGESAICADSPEPSLHVHIKE